LSDLYVYDLRSSRLQRLTNDAYAELHPAWSPDSRTIAFATDRFTTNLETLAIGHYELATIDAALTPTCNASKRSPAPTRSIRNGRATAGSCISFPTGTASPSCTRSRSETVRRRN
jgi:hypothetical protein